MPEMPKMNKSFSVSVSVSCRKKHFHSGYKTLREKSSFFFVLFFSPKVEGN